WLAQQASRRPALGPNVIRHADHVLGVVAAATPDATLVNLVVHAVNTSPPPGLRGGPRVCRARALCFLAVMD
ncbi:hypothetical protein, partial [Nocardia wallacei]|uniref:hypothetical protein n=1 Tax=Nocardia wallacei TaxID=480035 RepID=UPI002454E0C5